MDFMSDNDTLSTHSTMSATTTSGLNSVGSALRTYVFFVLNFYLIFINLFF